MLFTKHNQGKILCLLFVSASSTIFFGCVQKLPPNHISEDKPDDLKGFWESVENVYGETAERSWGLRSSLVIEERGLFRFSFLTSTKSEFLDSGLGHLKPKGKGLVFVDQHLFPLTWRLLDGDRLEISITHTLAGESPQTYVQAYRRRTEPTEADRAPWSWLNARMRPFRILEEGIEVYAAEHGTFPDPERPESLGPYLSKIPGAPTSGTGSPLRWVRKTDPSRVVLYGFGGDGVDGQGYGDDFAPLTLYGLNAECTSQSPIAGASIAGAWSTVTPFGDSSGMATAKIVLSQEGDVVSGTFTFTSLCNEAREDLGATSFPLEQGRFSGSRLSFVVPIVRGQPKECLLFELQLKGGKLKGSMKENDPKSKRLMRVEFQRD